MALRSPLTVQPYDYIGDSTGRPLDKGQIYIGVAGQDPEFYQIPVYLDAAMTKPIDQPIRTNDGFVDFAGSLSELYASAEVYSVKVLDKQGRKVLYKGDMTRKNLMSDALADLNQSIIDMQTAAQITLNAAVNSANTEVAQTVSSATAAIDTATTKSDKAATDADAAIKTLFENGGLPATPFKTKALMTASVADDGAYAFVTDDPDIKKIGLYERVGGAWQLSKYTPLIKQVGDVPGTLVTITDADGNPTWLQANDSDGGLTPDAESAIRNKLNILQDDGSIMLFAVLDADGNPTDLIADSRGQIPEFVLRSWGDRLKALGYMRDDEGEVIPTPDDSEANRVYSYPYAPPVMYGNAPSVARADQYYRDGEFMPAMADTKKVMLIGSSSLNSSTTLMTREFKLIDPDIEVYSPAFGSAITEQQIPLVGSKPFRFTVANNTINASGDTAVTLIDNVSIISGLINYTGWLSGIYGRMVHNGTSYTFTRLDTGNAVTSSGQVEFIPELGSQFRNAIQVIWVGKNNLTKGNAVINNLNTLIRNTDAIINYQASMFKRFVVMTHYNNTGTPAVSNVRTNIDNANAMYKMRYKNNCFDVEALLLSPAIFTALGLTKTADDIAEIALGNLAPSLSTDGAHCTTEVYEYIAQKLAAFMASNQFFGV